MSLYHFFWAKKERTVAVNRLNNSMVSLSFLDEEITRKITSHLLIESADNERHILNKNEIASFDEVDSLLASIEKAIGQPLSHCLPIERSHKDK